MKAEKLKRETLELNFDIEPYAKLCTFSCYAGHTWKRGIFKTKRECENRKLANKTREKMNVDCMLMRNEARNRIKM